MYSYLYRCTAQADFYTNNFFFSKSVVTRKIMQNAAYVQSTYLSLRLYVCFFTRRLRRCSFFGKKGRYRQQLFSATVTAIGYDVTIKMQLYWFVMIKMPFFESRIVGLGLLYFSRTPNNMSYVLLFIPVARLTPKFVFILCHRTSFFLPTSPNVYSDHFLPLQILAQINKGVLVVFCEYVEANTDRFVDGSYNTC